MKKLLIFIVILAIAALILKPSQKKHEEKIKAKIEQNLGVEEENRGESVVANIFSSLNNLTLKYHNYYVFSTMTGISGDLVSFGIFGFVVLTDDIEDISDQIKQKLEGVQDYLEQ